jgi:hypothetical protein
MKRLKILAFLLAAVTSVAAVQGASNWTFQGCWSQSGFGPCYDVFTDSSGAYWRCKACGTTNKPNSNTCFRISPSTGFWCS